MKQMIVSFMQRRHLWRSFWMRLDSEWRFEWVVLFSSYAYTCSHHLNMAIEDSLHRLCEQNFVQGLLAAFITDKDGVVILKCKQYLSGRPWAPWTYSLAPAAQQDAPENIVDPTFFTSFSTANNQVRTISPIMISFHLSWQGKVFIGI